MDLSLHQDYFTTERQLPKKKLSVSRKGKYAENGDGRAVHEF